ncbi:SDR family oxidoreductase [Vallitalea okinawensis]|uniref:SDR family oxidoreductase n=1 Tax=Vallitalea okinawensis TaxID=2078660 RepID=UPI000CFCE69C|nr:SDR family oxidoreductase [Vallitalea okinawensis]
MADLKDKVAVVTGGGGVLCGAFAKELGRHGIKVAILDLKKEAAEVVAKEINEAGGTAIGVECNVLVKESVEAAEREVAEKLGDCDILINGAGGNHPKGTTSKDYLEVEDIMNPNSDIKTFFDLDEEGIQFVFNLNFIGTLIPSQVFSKKMVNKEGTAILNVSSMNAFSPLTRIPAYSGAKAAVSNFTQWLAVHMSKVGIRVNAIAPGFFLTQQNYRLLLDENDQPTPRCEKILSQTPMDRLGKPEELFGTLMWLIDDKASGFVTGITVPVDGGFSAYSGV